MKKCLFFFLAGMLVLCPRPTHAAIIEFEAFLSGAQETPPNPSPGTGFGTVVLNDVLDTITVNFTFSGLTAPATAAHIHTGAPGVAGPVTFPFAGVPAATSGTLSTQVFSITPAQIVSLETGNMYMNIHDANFPGGEIRGQLEVAPEPGTAALMLTGATLGLLLIRRRAVRN